MEEEVKDIKMLIIPDVHGRGFWRDVIKGNEDKDIIFLGDYFDPYSNENLYQSDAIKEYKDIIEFKRNHYHNVTLLLGNHDLGYVYPSLKYVSRHDWHNEDEIRNLILENKDCFDLAAERTINYKRFFFTHAGLHLGWLNTYAKSMLSSFFDEEGNAEWNRVRGDGINCAFHVDLNHCIADNDFSMSIFGEILGIHSFYRGGFENYGSPIWADIREFDSTEYYNTNDSENPIIQIVGHTQVDNPLAVNNVYCLDARCGFYINSDGDVKPLDSGIEIARFESKKE